MTETPSSTERTVTLGRHESAIDDARRFAEIALPYCTPECREAVVLAVSELGENLVKYGKGDASAQAGTIGVAVDGHNVRVRAVNSVSTAEDAERVAEIVAELSAGSSVELYRARLLELFTNPELPRTQLGLLRMAFEGGFRLSCRFEAPELQIIAERTC